MNNRLSSSPSVQRPATNLRSRALWALFFCVLCSAPRANAGNAPSWMHALVNAPLPAHDDKIDAVHFYAERIVTVQSADKIKTLVREAYKILRPGGRDLATLAISFDSLTRIDNVHAWCIPAEGKDYEVK